MTSEMIQALVAAAILITGALSMFYMYWRKADGITIVLLGACLAFGFTIIALIVIALILTIINGFA